VVFEGGVGARRVGHHLIIEQVEVFALLHRNRFLVLRHRGSSDVGLLCPNRARKTFSPTVVCPFFPNGI
jgi:hypothetical protein